MLNLEPEVEKGISAVVVEVGMVAVAVYPDHYQNRIRDV